MIVCLKKFLFGLFIMYLIQGSSLQAQVGLDTLVNNLKESGFKGVLSGKTYESKIIQVPQELKCSPARHNYLWFKDQLVIQVDGSGMLYQYNKGGKLSRLDSTCFDGYNFGAFNFVYSDTIFSLGGYGFWQYNGMLRFYDEKTRGWEIIPTDKTVPIMVLKYSKAYYDQIKNKIYFIYIIPKPHHENFNPNQDKTVYVQCLDLKSKRWWVEPKLFNVKIQKNIEQFLIPGPFHSNLGMFFRVDNNIRLLDFENNLLFNIKKTKATQLEARLNKQNDLLLFSTDSLLCFYNPNKGVIDTVILGKNDLIDAETPIYKNQSKSSQILNNPLQLIAALITLAAVVIISWMVVKNRKLKDRNEFLLASHLGNGKKTAGEIILSNPESFRDNLTEVEKGLIDVLVTNTSNNEMTSINQLNQVLGISNKPVKIQNNIRATAIQVINKKFSVYSGVNVSTPVIPFKIKFRDVDPSRCVGVASSFVAAGLVFC